MSYFQVHAYLPGIMIQDDIVQRVQLRLIEGGEFFVEFCLELADSLLIGLVQCAHLTLWYV